MVDNTEDFDPVSAKAQQLFEGEEILHKARLIESDYRESLKSQIQKESFTARAKLALIDLVDASFDKNVILANNSSLDLRKLSFRIALNKTKLSFTKTDVMNPAYVSMKQNIENHFDDFVSRSYRMMERERQAERKTVQNVKYEDIPNQNAQPPKRGFGLNPFAKKKNEDENGER